MQHPVKLDGRISTPLKRLTMGGGSHCDVDEKIIFGSKRVCVYYMASHENDSVDPEKCMGLTSAKIVFGPETMCQMHDRVLEIIFTW